MARTKKPRPSFDVPPADPAPDTAASPGWVYRSDEDAARDVGDEPRRPPSTTPKRIVRTYSTLAAGAGLIPMPALDVVAIGALQVKMIAELAAHYGRAFRQDRAKAIVVALLGGATSTRLAYGFGGSLVKSIPIVGQLGGMVTMPALAAAVTYAVGQVFIQHFESGGTLLELDIEKARDRFQHALARAR